MELNEWQKQEYDYRFNNHEMGFVVAGLSLLIGYLNAKQYEDTAKEVETLTDKTLKLMSSKEKGG